MVRRGLDGLPDAETGHECLEDEESGHVREACHREDEQGVEGEEMRDQPCETRASEGSCRTADADNGADAGGWKHVGWRGEEVG